MSFRLNGIPNYLALHAPPNAAVTLNAVAAVGKLAVKRGSVVPVITVSAEPTNAEWKVSIVATGPTELADRIAHFRAQVADILVLCRYTVTRSVGVP